MIQYLRRREKGAYLWVAILFLIGLVLAAPVFADDAGGGLDGGSATGFTYQVYYPDNQIEKTGYYYLRTTPGLKQDLTLELKNSGNQPITIDLDFNSTKTNANGVLEYGKTGLKADASLKYDITKLVNYPKKVDLAGGETKKITLTVSAPDASYNGIILGGLELKKEIKPSKQANKTTGVVNRYAYMIAVVLREQDTKIAKNMALNQVFAGQSNFRNAIMIDLSNTQPEILEPLTIQAEIMGKTSDEVLYETQKTGMRMAPNTNIVFPVSLDGEKMKAGTYRAHIVATSDESRWEWTETFKISAETADKYNREDLGLVQTRSINWPLIAGIIFALLLAFFLIFVILHRRNQKKEEKLEAQMQAETQGLVADSKDQVPDQEVKEEEHD
jgi:preprotein translocase subunit SecG